ncbi:hypothetical protein WAI453_006582 [Rhynchosporium graminicola]
MSLSNDKNGVISSPWLNYDSDVLHIWNMDVCNNGVFRGGWYEAPKCLANIEVLVVSRNVLTRNYRNAVDPILCFRKLRVLIVLIDDASDFNRTWNLEATDRNPYKQHEGAYRDTLDFVQHSRGPFKGIVNNIEYKKYVFNDVRESLAQLQELFIEFTGPTICVASAQLRPRNSRRGDYTQLSGFVLENDDAESKI